MRCATMILVGALTATAATADKPDPRPARPSGNSGNCWVAASRANNVHPLLLQAIARVESNHNRHARAKAGSTHSIGLMQINSRWFDRLKERGITRDDLWQPCPNIRAGAWILSRAINRYGATWHAVGAYYTGPLPSKVNAPTDYAETLAAYRRYASDVKNELRRLLAAVGSEDRAHRAVANYDVDPSTIDTPQPTGVGSSDTTAIHERRRASLTPDPTSDDDKE